MARLRPAHLTAGACSLLAALLPSLLPRLLAADAAGGWHGEIMPAGLERGSARGEYRWQRDGAVMVFVPAGPFTMGSENGERDERPMHTVFLDGFYIDKHEVSWQRWRSSGLPMPPPPDWGTPDDMPVVNVDWHQAQAYAQWAGKRLPTEAEWEKAARGTDGRSHPWGEQPVTPERAVWRHHPIAQRSTAPVDCCAAGASPYGALNLAGNVYEWCQDVYDKGFYARSPLRNPRHDGPGRHRVLRGGAFVLELEDLRSAYRYRLLPQDRTPYIGLRTVLSAVPVDDAPP